MQLRFRFGRFDLHLLATTMLVLMAAVAIPANAGDSRSVRFRHLSQNDGLSQSFVFSIIQDRQGFMWFGTQEGLNRFDGFEYTVFSHDLADPTSISDESIRTMIEDRSGTLWIGTDAGGLSKYDAARESFINYLHDPEDTNSIAGNKVRVIYEDRAGYLWIGTDGTGLDRFDPQSETFEHYRHDPSNKATLGGAHVWSVLQHSDGTLWVSTDRGLSKFDAENNSFTTFRHDPDDPSSISEDRTRTLFEDNENTLWIGTESTGLNRFNPVHGTFDHFDHDPDDPLSISANRINTIFQDDAGILWIGTVKGLNAWNPGIGGFKRYFHNPSDRYSLSDDTVLSMYQDRGDILWIGTYDGVNLRAKATRTMLHYRVDVDDPQSLSENAVTSFAENTDGSVWVGTFGGGLNLLDPDGERFSHLRHQPGNGNTLSDDRVMALHVDNDGVLWAGTLAAGLNRYDRESASFTRFRHDPNDPGSLSSDGVTYILESHKTGLWIGTFGGGLNHFDRQTGQFTHYQHDPDDDATLSSDRIMTLFEDRDGSIWIGTYGNGLNRFNTNTNEVTRFAAEPDRPDGLSGNEIYVIEEDRGGDLWLGIKGGGLNRWRRPDREAGRLSFQRFTELDGLPDSTIYSGVWDQGGRLWLSTGRGLSTLDIDTLEFKSYQTAHGLQGNEFNLSAGLMASDGQLYFGGVNGFNAFQPGDMENNRRPPPVAITHFLGLNSPVDLDEFRASGTTVSLSHEQDVIGFEFAALDYAAPEDNRYMYKLEGLDENWVDAGMRRHVTYSNLPAGKYTFSVKAANGDGVWSERDAQLEFRLNAPPWRTWWAYAFYLLVIGAILTYWINSRRARRKVEFEYTESLRHLRDRWREAQRIARIGNWEWNIATGELWWSDEIYRLFEVDRNEFVPTYGSFLERVHPDDLATVEEAIERAQLGEEPFSIDHRIVLPDGNERVLQSWAELIYDKKRIPVRLAGTVYDVTERKKAENIIKHRADYQTLLARLSSDLIRAQPEQIEQQLQDSLYLVGTRYNLDAISVWWFTPLPESLRPLHRWTRDENRAPLVPLSQSDVPWIAQEILANNLVTIDNVDKLPESAASDQSVLRKLGVKSLLIVPLLVDEKLEGACVLAMLREPCHWCAETIAELRLLTGNLAGAIALSRAMSKIEHLKNKLQQENHFLREEVRLAHGFDEIIGDDPALEQCLLAVEKVAPTDVSTLILGETGTGKELIARAIHKLSGRCDRPMVSVNCPALPASLIESELFGHEKGAFTGALSRRRGRFELADSGTLFLDEIGELPLELQGKLLRVLQTGEFQRLGGTKTLYADVRLIAATNRNLQSAIKRGEFREDLYYRINSFPITLPALRDRRGDIPMLAEHFVHKHAGRLGKKVDAISAWMIRELLGYSWPGNIRELENIIERSLISTKDNAVLTLPGPLRLIASMHQSKTAIDLEDETDLFSVERSHIVSILEQTQWKISGADGAASLLGIPSSTLRSKMKRLSIVRQSP